jgi:hypothetical protein
VEVLQLPKLEPELSCCLQDGQRRRQKAKPVQPNALSPKLRCCLQDSAAAASGPGFSVAGGYVPLPWDTSRDIASSNRDFGRATCVGCPGKPHDIQSRLRSFACDTRFAVVSGIPARRKPADATGTLMAESSLGNSGSAFHSYRRCRTPRQRIAPQPDLETSVECYRVTANAFADFITGGIADVLNRG